MNILICISLVTLFLCDNLVIYKLVANKRKGLTEKQRAYILSCKAALTLFFVGVMSNVLFISSKCNGNAYIENLPESVKLIQKLSVLVFLSYLLADTVIGFFNYHTQMKTLSGYVHHIVYILICAVSMCNNNYSILMLFMMAELPTFLLSVGSFDKKKRTNVGFGLTFLLTRILYHVFLLWQFRSNTLVFRIGTLILCLHIFWFIKWCKHIRKTV